MKLEQISDLLRIAREAGTKGEWELDTNAPFSSDLQGVFCAAEKRYPIKFEFDEQPLHGDAAHVATFDPIKMQEILTDLYSLQHLADVIETIKKTGGSVEIRGVRVTPVEEV